MQAELDPELLQFFVEEACGYLPLMRQARESYAADPTRRHDLENLHRHAHSIKGSAALLGLPELSRVAYLIEDLLDDVLENKIDWNADIEAVVKAAIELVDRSVNGLPLADFDAAAVTAEAEALFATIPNRDVAEPTAVGPQVAPTTFEDELDAPEPDLAVPALVHAADEADEDDADDTVLESSIAFAPTSEELEELLPEVLPMSAEPAAELEPVSPELLEIFSLEADEHLKAVHVALPLLQERPGDKEQVQAIRRAAHTLKGAAAMVGFRAITKLAHRMEDVLDELYEAPGPVPAKLFPLLYRTADALTDLAAGKPIDSDLPELYQGYDAAMTSLAGTVDSVSNRPEIDQDEVAAQVAAAAKRGTQYVRVPIERLDELTKLVGELVIARTGFEQRTADYLRMMEELRLSSARLKKCGTKLETEFATRALGGQSVGTATSSAQDYGFDSLEFDRYTDFHLVTRELAETTTDVQTIGNELSYLYGELEGFVSHKARLTGELQDKLMRIRMVPFGTLAAQLQRAVRTTADAQFKRISLVLEGERTDLDKTVLEEMSEPLLHLLRNAVDHGLETPSVRREVGKPERGTIRVRAFPEGSQVVIAVSDDGRGIDLDAVRRKAVANGLVTEAQAAELTEAEVYKLMFAPGFSTAAGVSEISGRGVGLDIVLSKVEKLKGTVVVSSVPGEGTTFAVRLPLTLAVTRALMLVCQGQTFALPLGAVEHIMRLEDEPIDVGGKPMLKYAGQLCPLVDLGSVLQLPTTTEQTSKHPPVLILNAGAVKTAIVVDKILGGREIVVKTLGDHVRKVRGVGGATLLGDGSVVLILNPNDLAPSSRRAEKSSVAPTGPRPSAKPKRTQVRVMIVDDSPSVRRVLAALVQRTGWLPMAAKDGVEALEILEREAMPPDIVLSDVEMPRMDGYELLGTLKNRPEWRGVPVVMITSRSGDKHRRKAMELGASGYLVKPYQEEALLATVRKLVPRT